MQIILDRHLPTPLYVQIRDRLRHLIQTGNLAATTKLPSIRVLAESLQVNKLTVIEAYSGLEAEGLIHARQGAGYFVSCAVIDAPRLRSTFAPAQRVIIQEQGKSGFFEQFTASVRAQQQGDIIDFSSGFPRVPCTHDLQKIAKRALNHAADALFRYDLPQGQRTLQQQIAQLLVMQGLTVSPDDVMITNGSEQALYLAMHHYLRPGDWVIVESPTYHGALGILENLGAKVIGIPISATGMNLELLEQYLRSHRPKLIYTISTLHNPTGLTTSLAHRQQLLALAEHYECPILEDNAYEGLNFEPVPPPIKALDQRDWVIYINTFSKTLMPGLRVGHMVVTGPNYRPILEQKLLQDLHGSTVSQAIVSEFLASGYYRRHLNRMRTTTLQSRNTMLQAMERYFPAEVSWTIPQGGLFLWVQLPDRITLRELCRDALAEDILIADGAAFFPGQQGYKAIRLNFSHPPEAIDQGIAVLGRLLKHQLKHTRLDRRHLQDVADLGSNSAHKQDDIALPVGV